MTKKSKIDQFNEWVKTLVYPGDNVNFIQCNKEYVGETEHVKIICLYTKDHKYSIHASDVKNEEGYLGCVASTRKMRAGETWLRGNDLPDGPLTKDTWSKILNGIIRYELIQLSQYSGPHEVPFISDDEEDKK